MEEKIILPDFNPRGLITIELFDDLTNKKIEEIRTHNFIAKGVKDYLMKLAMKSLFTKNRATGGLDLYRAINDPFRMMYLTDASHPEAPTTEWLMKGKQIGLASTTETYSGSDSKRGSYNQAESFTNLEQVHIVIDFPTHAANGTFNSIYFAYNGNKFDNTNFLQKTFENYSGSVKKYGNYIYALRDNEFHKYDLNFNLIESYNLPNYKYDFEIYNDYVYFADISQPIAIQRASLSNPTSLTTIINNVNLVGGICFDTTNNQFIVANSNSSSRISIRKYDINFNLLSNFETTYMRGYDSIQTFYDNGDIILGDAILNGNDLVFAAINQINGIIDNKILIGGYYLIPKLGISSRALLDSPVTKTSSTTMKITYDFILE